MFEFQFSSFILIAWLAGTIIAITAPIIGTFLVVRRYAPLADTLAHVSLVGVAIGLVSGLPPLLTATVTSVFTSLWIEKLRSQRQIYGESILVIFLSGSLGIASLLISSSRSINANLNSFLFGNINTITTDELVQIAAVSVVVIGLISYFYRQLFLVCLDEELAQTSGLRVGRLNNLLIVLSALTISISISSIGVLLISALVVIPVVAANQFKLSFRNTLYLSIVFSVLSVWIGLGSSYLLNLASSGSIVLANLIIFCLSLVWSQKQ